ncbi:class I SAM-dependent methyltransferase [Bacillus shivajii]|uniref:class I SAM-dependent methyltransferase n=1 Tax=Bacillus shivajii TaxID=1983719 RepID=UPI001CF9FB02|nr:class I SAM-dependent methyltransferase [Bacillus shivajii]UCZ51926.1 class I SAM-dependent methyltransferase [Bacillus shivajii]
MEDIKDTYNKLARVYAQHVDQDSPYNADYERPAMLKEIPENLKGKKVLDAGCSAGWYTDVLTSRGADVTGIDISPAMIEVAKQRLNSDAHLLCHDLKTTLPFQNDEFDYIASSLTLHYLKDWAFTFSEFQRVLRPNGTFLFSTHHPFMDFTKFPCDDYFETKLLKDTWNKPNLTIDVSFYRRSMEQIMRDTTKFFSLEALYEPRPHERMKETAPKSYQYLKTHPHFLIIKAKCRKEDG